MLRPFRGSSTGFQVVAWRNRRALIVLGLSVGWPGAAGFWCRAEEKACFA